MWGKAVIVTFPALAISNFYQNWMVLQLTSFVQLPNSAIPIWGIKAQDRNTHLRFISIVFYSIAGFTFGLCLNRQRSMWTEKARLSEFTGLVLWPDFLKSHHSNPTVRFANQFHYSTKHRYSSYMFISSLQPQEYGGFAPMDFVLFSYLYNKQFMANSSCSPMFIPICSPS